MTKVLYLDESGTSNLKKIDSSYPIFLLGGVVVDYDDLEYNKKTMDELKTKYFGDTNVILHSNEISRRKGIYEFLNEGEMWFDFLSDLNNLMECLRYNVVACVVDIKKLVAKYGNKAFDPYEYALRIVLERFIYSMGSYETGKIFAESRGKLLDNEIHMAFEKIKDTGAGCYINSEEICSKIRSFEIKNKKDNLVGLQIADLALPPIGRNYLGKKNKSDYDIILKKCFNKNGIVEGNGIVYLPK